MSLRSSFICGIMARLASVKKHCCVFSVNHDILSLTVLKNSRFLLRTIPDLSDSRLEVLHRDAGGRLSRRDPG